VIIVNADDLGRSRAETDRALACYARGRITSTSAMVYMRDSARAAELALASGIDVGLHVNLTEALTAAGVPAPVRERHASVVRFLTRHPYALVVYNPALRGRFRDVYNAQVDEFCRLYGRRPSHIDGHHHKHLCTNMLLGGVIPRGERVRRSFSYWPGEKSAVKLAYRRVVDAYLQRRFHVTDYFFGLLECLEAGRLARVFELARSCDVEVMTHPAKANEYAYLSSDGYGEVLGGMTTGTYGVENRPPRPI
jgi:predicted glycoside hydrolase/deacetylase ChbG (UPF0249 family)